MLIVKLMKYGPSSPEAAGQDARKSYTESFSIYQAGSIHVNLLPDLKTGLQLDEGRDNGAPREFTVGAGKDCEFDVAYIMNAEGKTVETIR